MLGTLLGVSRRSRLSRAALAFTVAATTIGAGTGTLDAVATGSVAAPFTVQGSVEQVAVVGAQPGAAAQLRSRAGSIVARKQVDAAGAALFREVEPGDGYVVTIANTRSEPVSVSDPADTPPSTFYSSQRIGDGYGYLTTRDGTLLSINVTLPGPADLGPYPTVVEYSGYDPSNPNGRAPASTVAQALGYATVGVNLRGTGCSGGSWHYFETLQSLDGYDTVETIAAQPWVAHGMVGMVGISYPGIAQLFVAQTRPPHLAAITPLSVIDDTYQTLYPGGVFNNGFAAGWADDRADDAEPAGQRWAESRIAAGDKTCEANQALRLQTPDVLTEMKRLRYYQRERSDATAPVTFVDRINVPTFLAGAWQDEETGAHFANMLDDFAPGVPVKFTLMNGVHSDSLGPAVVARWAEFLDFYVARRIPTIPNGVRTLANGLLAQFYGPGVTLPADRFSASPDYASALAAYEQELPVRVLFGVGAGGSPGTPIPAFEDSFASWPPPTTEPTSWYFADDGKLVGDAPATATGADTFTYDPDALPRTVASKSGGVGGIASFVGAPAFDWKPLPTGKAASYVTEPLSADTVMLGTGSVDLWVRTAVADIDLEVTISEVRADGNETYVQSGWLKASARKLDDARSSELLPVPTYTKQDAAPLPKNKDTLIRIPLFPFGHEFKAGSRVRIVVQPPGGNRPSWAFDAVTYDDAPEVSIARTKEAASKVVLPVVPGVARSTAGAACDSLRGQACRPYEALNGGS